MLAKPRVEQPACLLGQSLRTGRRPPPPPTACMSTLNCACVCVCERVCARAVRSERRVRGSACSKRVPVMRANRAPGPLRVRHAGALGGTGWVLTGWSREETAIKYFNCVQPGSPVM